MRSWQLGDGVMHLEIHAVERNLDVCDARCPDGGEDPLVQEGQVGEDADREVVLARHVEHATEVRVRHGLAAREREGGKPHLVALVQDAATEVHATTWGFVYYMAHLPSGPVTAVQARCDGPRPTPEGGADPRGAWCN